MWSRCRRTLRQSSRSKCGSTDGPHGGADRRGGGTGRRTPALQGLRVPAPGERAPPREGSPGVVRWAGGLRRIRRDHLPGRRGGGRGGGGRGGGRAGGSGAASPPGCVGG